VPVGETAVKQSKIDEAIKLVDKMVNLGDEPREKLKRHIPEAACGDEQALGYLTRFLYDRKNRDITSRIIFLILRDWDMSRT